jgi:hypothetical protein
MDPVTFFVTLGISLATSYANYLLAPTPADVVGSRLTDKSSQMNASYGQSRAKCWGTVQLPANVLQMSEIRETSHVQQEGKKKHAYTVTSYTYAADVALGFGQGPCTRFLDLYADSKLIWSGSLDANGNPRPFAQSSDIGTITFYYGTETQLPDPTLEGLVGTGNQSGYRGEVYIVLGNLQLANFGNRIPVFKANISYASGNDAYPITHIDGADGGVIVKDPTGRPFVYTMNGTTVMRVNIISNQIEEVGDLTTITGLVGPTPNSRAWECAAVGMDGNMYVGGADSYGYGDIQMINPITMGYIKQLGFGSSVLGQPASMYIINTVMPFTKNGKQWVCASDGGFIGFYDPATDSSISGGTSYPNTAMTCKTTITHGVPKNCMIADKDGKVWAVGGHYICEVPSTPNDYSSGVGTNTSIDHDLTAGVVSDPHLLIYVASNHSVLIWDAGRGGIVNIDLATFQEIGFTAGYTALSNSAYYDGLSSDGNYVLDTTDGSTFAKLNPAGVVRDYDALNWLPSFTNHFGQGPQWMYDAQSNSVFMFTGYSPAELYRIYLDRGLNAGATLKDVVEDLHVLAGLTLGAVDADDLVTQTVQGMALTDNQSVRDTLRMLTSAYIFDGFESDGKVIYRWRTGSSVLTIPEDDLAASENTPSEEDPLPVDFANEQDAPMRVEVQFYDATRNYDTNAMEAKRIQNPDPTMLVKSTMLLKLPIVMTATEAAQLAERVLWYRWASRINYEIKTKWKHVRLNPCDIFTVTYNGKNYEMRVLQTDLGATPILVIKAEAHDPQAYISSRTGDSGRGFQQVPIVAVVPTEFFALDTPLISNSDTATTGFYGATCSYSSDWRGAVIYMSLDGVDWTPIGTSNIASPWAHVLLALGDWDAIGAFDNVNELTIKMIDGVDPPDYSKLDVLNSNKGLVALVKTDGSVELLNYTTSAAIGDPDAIGQANPIPPSEPPPANFQATHLEESTTWKQPGNVGDSGGGDPNAAKPGTFTPGAVGVWQLNPNYAFNNAFWYQKFGAHNTAVKFVYRLKLQIPTPADVAACRCIEWHVQQNVNDHLYNMAWQANFDTNKWRMFNYNTTSWEDTGLAINPADWSGGNWVDLICQCSRTATVTTHESISINGVSHAIGATHAYTAKVENDYVSVAFQLDSQASADPYRVNAKDMSVEMYDSADAIILTPTPTALVNRQFTLTGLLRGRRGTEWNSTGHTTNEHAVFLNAPLRFLESLNDRSKLEYIRAASTGQSTDAGVPVPFTLQCNDLKPYAPCFIRGYKNASDLWSIYWERRTRYDGEWQDGIETVPLNEESELYDIEICTTLGVVKRTWTDSPVKYIFYTAAMQVTDFGGVQTEFMVNIYQKSAAVGRGFQGSAIIDINGNYGAEPTIATDDPFQVNGA